VGSRPSLIDVQSDEETMTELSDRIREIVDALPLASGMRVVEIGCGPGAAARAVCARVGPTGRVLAVDRSPRAIDQLIRASAHLIDTGRLTPLVADADELVLPSGACPFDLAFAVRVGVFDGRHPDGYEAALRAVRRVLTPQGRMFIDGGNPLREIDLGRPAEPGNSTRET
jgi:ubiquinone/menaquinone biosynthesis C-methylase UbiE